MTKAPRSLLAAAIALLPAVAQASAPPYCEILANAPGVTVTAVANETGTCLYQSSPSATPTEVPCNTDQEISVDVTWDEPPTESVTVLRCVVGNPTTARAGDGYEQDCLVIASPTGCTADIFGVTASAGGMPLEDTTGIVRCDAQQTGESHPAAGVTYVEDFDPITPGPQSGFISNSRYCQGLAETPFPFAAPWAAQECCRVYGDVFYDIAPAPGLTEVHFRIQVPFVFYDDDSRWRFVVPSCGDGVRYCGEECDDGDADGDGCGGPNCVVQGCGTPVSGAASGPAASDALYALRASVGASACDACICDVDLNGFVSATDALVLLKHAVGALTDTLACVQCQSPPAPNAVEPWDPFLMNWPMFATDDPPFCSVDLGYIPLIYEPGCLRAHVCRTCGTYTGYDTLGECEATLSP